MPATVAVTYPPAGPQTRRCALRDDSGLITLDWLLLVAAVTVIAAVTALAAQRIVEEETIRPADAAVRLIDADIEAAFVESESRAEAIRLATMGQEYSELVDEDFRRRCERLDDRSAPDAFGDVVETASWVPDPAWQLSDFDEDRLTNPREPNPGECIVRPCAVPFRSPCTTSASLLR